MYYSPALAAFGENLWIGWEVLGNPPSLLHGLIFYVCLFCLCHHPSLQSRPVSTPLHPPTNSDYAQLALLTQNTEPHPCLEAAGRESADSALVLALVCLHSVAQEHGAVQRVSWGRWLFHAVLIGGAHMKPVFGVQQGQLPGALIWVHPSPCHLSHLLVRIPSVEAGQFCVLAQHHRHQVRGLQLTRRASACRGQTVSQDEGNCQNEMSAIKMITTVKAPGTPGAVCACKAHSSHYLIRSTQHSQEGRRYYRHLTEEETETQREVASLRPHR